MELFLDQDVYAATARFLKKCGHTVTTASEAGKSTADDTEILEFAMKAKKILVTRDKDFGHLVFARKIKSGVILLRITPSTIDRCHQELKRVLEENSFQNLFREFTVIEPGRYRTRKFTD